MRKHYIWKDQPTLPEPFGNRYIDYDECADDLLSSFANEYESIRLYHLCRPINVEKYKTDGLRVGSSELLQSIVHETFQALEKEIDSAKIAEAVNSYEYQEGCLFLALDHEFMLEWAGHYSIYGSERLMAVFEKLGVSKELLTTVGVPTIVMADLPLKELPHDDLRLCLIEINNAQIDGIEEIDVAFVLTDTLPASSIVGFDYPETIVNRLEAGEIYRVRN